MRVSDGFRAFVLDQLSGVDGMRAKDMFGGIGLYAGDVFFGILASDVLYLKVDETNRGEYEAAGTEPFRPYADRPMTMAYYAVPLEVLETAPTLIEWAERSVSAARASKSTAKSKPKSTTKRTAKPKESLKNAARRAVRRRK
jgi:DNA transformation protein